jgi:hypothetical protein
VGVVCLGPRADPTYARRLREIARDAFTTVGAWHAAGWRHRAGERQEFAVVGAVAVDELDGVLVGGGTRPGACAARMGVHRE